MLGYVFLPDHFHMIIQPNYIHFNPVKHRYIKNLRDWLNSSYIEWENRGLYPPAFDWDEPKGVDWGE
jgi:hypothetical protein